MIFQSILAIDWSGARSPISNKKIQVAQYNPADQTVRPVYRNHGDRESRWSRTTLFDHIQRTVTNGHVLIGFDFAFAYPYCDERAYFPREAASPTNRQCLWAVVEERCNEVGNSYGGPFYRDAGSPFREFHRYKGFQGLCFRERYRLTDQAAQDMRIRLNPSSVFKCIGPSPVGPGSVAGMRFLCRIQNETNAFIWPFHGNHAPDRSTVVEIYPRLFLRQAKLKGIQPTANNIEQLCLHFGAELLKRPPTPTDDERDALVSAAGMGQLIRKGPAWQVPACAAEYEGWIFGVPVG